MTATWFARVGVAAAVGILWSGIALHVSAAPPPIFRDTRLFTVGAVDTGTSSVAVPDLGTVSVVCAADGFPNVTLTSSVLFDWFVATSPDGDTGRFNQTSWTSGHLSETLWLRNAAGQWRLEYFGHVHPEPDVPGVCSVAVVITRIL